MGVAPDLQVKQIYVAAPGDGCGELSDEAQIAVVVINDGDLRVGADVVVRLQGIWNNDDPRNLLNAAGEPIQAPLGAPLEPGQERRLDFTYSSVEDSEQPEGLPRRVIALVDADGDPFFGRERECIEDNNFLEADFAAPEGLADLHIENFTAQGATCPRSVLAATITNIGAQAAGSFNVAFYGGDPQRGGQEHKRVNVPNGLMPGETITVESVSTELRFGSLVRMYAFVDPEDAVPECRNDNNAHVAPPIRCIQP
jgi:hypothetical protein